MVLRSKHICGFNIFFRPHQREYAFRKRGGPPPFDTLARSLVMCILKAKGGLHNMTRHNAYARIEQISIQASGCKRVRVVARQLGTVLNRLQVNYVT